MVSTVDAFLWEFRPVAHNLSRAVHLNVMHSTRNDTNVAGDFNVVKHIPFLHMFTSDYVTPLPDIN